MSTTVGTLLVKLRADFGDFKRQMQGISTTLKNNAKGFKMIGAAATAAAAVIAVASVKALQSTVKFEKGMAKLGAVSNTLGTKDFATLEKKALSLASATQFTANEVVEGMNFMAMAGNDAQKILSGMPSVLQLAAAATMDLGQASNIVTNIMAGFGHTAEELAHDNDVLVRAITGANVDVQQLGESFKYVGPVAKSAGVEFEEVTAAIAMLGNVGIQGSMAGTTLRGAITKLLAPTRQGAAEMKKLGLNATDSNGRLLGFDKIIRQLEPHAQNTAAMMKIFGLRAGPGMAALVSLGADKLGAFTERLKESGITAQGIADAQMNTLWGQLKILGSQFERLQIELGSAFLPLLSDLAKSLQSVFQAFIDLSPETKKWAAYLIAAAGALATVVAGVAAVAVLLPSMLAGFVAIKGALIAIPGLIVALAPIALPFIAIAAAVGIAAKSLWELRDAGTNVTETLAMAFGTTEDVVRQLFRDMGNTMWSWVDEAGYAVVAFSGSLMQGFRDIGKSLNAWWEYQTNEIGDKLTLWGSIVDDVLPQAWLDAYNAIINYSNTFDNKLITALESLLTTMSDKLVKWVAKAKGILGGIGEVLGTAKDFWFGGAGAEGGGAAAGGAAAAAKETAEILAAKKAAAAFDKFRKATDDAAGAMSGAASEVSDEFKALVDATKASSMGMWNLTELEKARVKIVKAGIDISGLVEEGATLAGPAMPGVQVSGGPGVDQAVSTAGAGLQDAAQRFREGMQGVGQMVMDSVIQGGENMSAAMSGAMQGAQVAGPWGAIIGALLALAKKTKAFGSIVKILDAILDPVIAQLQSLLSSFVPLIRELGATFSFIIRTSSQLGMFANTMKVLSGVLGIVARVLGFVTDLIASTWNGIINTLVSFAKAIGWDSLAKALHRARIQIERTTTEASPMGRLAQSTVPALNDSMGSLTNTAASLNEALLNAPEGFKAEQRRFEASRGDYPGGGIEAGGGAGVNIENMTVDTTNAAGFMDELNILMGQENSAENGTPVGSGAPLSVDSNGA